MSYIDLSSPQFVRILEVYLKPDRQAATEILCAVRGSRQLRLAHAASDQYPRHLPLGPRARVDAAHALVGRSFSMSFKNSVISSSTLAIKAMSAGFGATRGLSVGSASASAPLTMMTTRPPGTLRSRPEVTRTTLLSFRSLYGPAGGQAVLCKGCQRPCCRATIWMGHGRSVATDDSHWPIGRATTFFRASSTSS